MGEATNNAGDKSVIYYTFEMIRDDSVEVEKTVSPHSGVSLLNEIYRRVELEAFVQSSLLSTCVEQNDSSKILTSY